MYEKQTNTVNRLKRYTIEHYDPQMIILYGSTARGDTDEFSDIDMMVIMDVPDYETVAEKILSDTDHIVHDKHIMIKTTADYYSQKDIPGTMVYSALIEGVILYRRSDFDPDTIPLKSYKERKKYVIQREYLDQIYDFLKKAESALANKQVYRCRDFLRFSVIRALKAVIVFKDVHPPRSTDLKILYARAQELLPEIDKFCPFIEELDGYRPEHNITNAFFQCMNLVDKTGLVVDGITLFLK